MDKLWQYLATWRQNAPGTDRAIIDHILTLLAEAEEEHEKADKLIMECAHEVAQKHKNELTALRQQHDLLQGNVLEWADCLESNLIDAREFECRIECNDDCLSTVVNVFTQMRKAVSE